MQIDWSLLLLIVIGALFVLGLVLALQTAAGRKRLGEAALALAERLLAYAVRWLERSLPDQGIAGVAPVSHDIDRAAGDSELIASFLSLSVGFPSRVVAQRRTDGEPA